MPGKVGAGFPSGIAPHKSQERDPIYRIALSDGVS